MELERGHTVKIVEVCKVSPTPCSKSSLNFSLSLTPFDYQFLNSPLSITLLLYPHTHSGPWIFLDSIIPKLKHSLSLTLQHFLPVAGSVVWPENSPEPFILYTPKDGVSFTVAETDSDFNQFSCNQARKTKEYRSLAPTVEPSDTQVPILSLQVTKFRNDGFSLALASHHVLFDGLSLSLFLKAWAHICKLNEPPESLPDQLTPSFDRNAAIFQTVHEVIPQTKSLKFFSYNNAQSSWIHGAFELTPTHIEKLKKRVFEETLQNNNSPSEDLQHLSTFVVVYAYVLICLVKTHAQHDENEHKFLIAVTGDARGLVEPPISNPYFGNCLAFAYASAEEREFKEEDGLPKIAKKISDLVVHLKKLGHVVHERSTRSQQEEQMLISGVKICKVAGSPKFKVYETDFGWGKPKKIHFLSLGENSISLFGARDGGGGVEVGVVLPNLLHMDTFASIFSKGLCKSKM